jgi:hypothetical protein
VPADRDPEPHRHAAADANHPDQLADSESDRSLARRDEPELPSGNERRDCNAVNARPNSTTVKSERINPQPKRTTRHEATQISSLIPSQIVRWQGATNPNSLRAVSGEAERRQRAIWPESGVSRRVG